MNQKVTNGKCSFEDSKKKCLKKFNNLMQQIQITEWRIDMKQAIMNFNLQHYKLDLLNTKGVNDFYLKLDQKYQKLENQEGRIYWFQNQLKIFVWLAIAASKTFGVPFESYVICEIFRHKNRSKIYNNAFFYLNKGLIVYQYQLLTTSSFDDNWSLEEIILLKKIFTKYNFNGSWTTISKELFLESNNTFLRTAHSCREKWQNHLDTRLVKGNWTIEQDYSIIKNRLLLGKKWSLITKIFGPTRTEHMVKNRYKTILKRQSSKKQIRSIQELQICKEIQNKLFIQLSAQTAPSSLATATTDYYSNKLISQKQEDIRNNISNNNQNLPKQDKLAFVRSDSQPFHRSNTNTAIDQNPDMLTELFFQPTFEENDFKIPFTGSFEFATDLRIFEEDFHQPILFLKQPEYEHLL